MSQPKEQRIASFEKFGEVVNEDNVDILCANFYCVVKSYLKLKEKHPRLTFSGFVWIDDGKTGVLGLEINGKTL